MVERQEGEPVLKRATVYSAVFAASASPGNGLMQKAVLGAVGVALVATADLWTSRKSPS